jgi:hypothetical protein
MTDAMVLETWFQRGMGIMPVNVYLSRVETEVLRGKINARCELVNRGNVGLAASREEAEHLPIYIFPRILEV